MINVSFSITKWIKCSFSLGTLNMNIILLQTIRRSIITLDRAMLELVHCSDKYSTVWKVLSWDEYFCFSLKSGQFEIFCLLTFYLQYYRHNSIGWNISENSALMVRHEPYSTYSQLSVEFSELHRRDILSDGSYVFSHQDH